MKLFSTSSHSYDPLAELEQVQKPRVKRKHPLVFLFHYLLLSTTVFTILFFSTNFSAYSARISYWMDQDGYSAEEASLNSLLLSSVTEVQASNSDISRDESLETIKEKISEKMPDLLYENTTNPSRLLTHIDTSTKKVSFRIAPYENRIIIPKIGKNIPLVNVELGGNFDFDHMENIFMDELQKGVVRYPGTALPGQVGNAFIFGHSSNYPWIQGNYNDVFALLDNLSAGDDIIVYYNQMKYTYRVQEKTIVKPGDVKALQSRDPEKKELSLMTCWPIGTDLKRMIVFTELLESTADTESPVANL